MRTQTLVIIGLLALAAPLAAQEEEPNRWSAQAGLALNASGGNEQISVITATAGFSHLETDIYELTVDGRFRYGESEGVRVARNLRGNANMDLWPQANWSPFLFATAEQDPIKKLEARLNGGVGAKRTFFQDGWDEVSVSGAILYSYENLEVDPTIGDGINQTARWSWRVRGRKEFSPGSRLEQVLFWQPAFSEFEDYQLEAITKLRIALSEQLSLSTDFVYQRDNTPAPDVLPDDYALSVGLSLATEW